MVTSLVQQVRKELTLFPGGKGNRTWSGVAGASTLWLGQGSHMKCELAVCEVWGMCQGKNVERRVQRRPEL